MHIELLNSEIIPVLNITLVSYRDLNLQNANKMTSIQDFAITSTSTYNVQSMLVNSQLICKKYYLEVKTRSCIFRHTYLMAV